MDPGQFVGVAKNFEHRVDAEGVLAEANRAYARRFLHIGQPLDGLVRLEGMLDAEGGAVVQTALDRLMPPQKSDDRNAGQRRADSLVELCRQSQSSQTASSRPHLIIRASLETLTHSAGSPAGELESGAQIPAETVRRLACDGALTRITGRGELDAEISRASRTIPPATRRALITRDQRCRAQGCDRQPGWCDAHHTKPDPVDSGLDTGPAVAQRRCRMSFDCVGGITAWCMRSVGSYGVQMMAGGHSCGHSRRGLDRPDSSSPASRVSWRRRPRRAGRRRSCCPRCP